MKSDALQILRRAALQVLEANPARYGLRVSVIRVHLRAFGLHKVSEVELESSMGLLEEQGMIAAIADPLSPGVRAWRITDEGRSFLEEDR